MLCHIVQQYQLHPVFQEAGLWVTCVFEVVENSLVFPSVQHKYQQVAAATVQCMLIGVVKLLQTAIKCFLGFHYDRYCI